MRNTRYIYLNKLLLRIKSRFSSPAKGRLPLLDEVRGLAIIAMVAYHLFYSMAFLFDMPVGLTVFNAAQAYEPLIVGVFILVSGCSSRLSRSNLKRGLWLIPCAAVVSLVTLFFTPELVIVFGILHFLALAIIIFHFILPLVRKIPPLAGFLCCVFLFAALYGLPEGYIGVPGFSVRLPEILYRRDFLFWLGFTSPTFGSEDYFPLLPWFFLFLSGAFIGTPLAEGRAPEFMRRSYARPLGFLGRHSLVIYLAHQPVILAVLWVVSRV